MIGNVTFIMTWIESSIKKSGDFIKPVKKSIGFQKIKNCSDLSMFELHSDEMSKSNIYNNSLGLKAWVLPSNSGRLLLNEVFNTI